MAWRDTTNKDDCGVFAMHHMETYVGLGTTGWDCGLNRGDISKLDIPI